MEGGNSRNLSTCEAHWNDHSVGNLTELPFLPQYESLKNNFDEVPTVIIIISIAMIAFINFPTERDEFFLECSQVVFEIWNDALQRCLPHS